MEVWKAPGRELCLWAPETEYNLWRIVTRREQFGIVCQPRVTEGREGEETVHQGFQFDQANMELCGMNQKET